MNAERDRRKIQFGITLVVLLLIVFILIMWILSGRQADVSTPQGNDPEPGQTIIAGEANAHSSTAEFSGDDEVLPADDMRDPQKENAGLPDEGMGAKASLEGTSDSHAAGTVTLGIDVSKWQGKIDWQQVASSGVDFAMIRIGFRTTDTGEICADPYAAYNLQHAAQAGIQTGVYFFSTAANREEAIEEAAWTVDFIAGYSITYPVAYNCEGFLSSDSRMYGISSGDRTDNALAFLQVIEDAGYEAIFHASKHDLTDAASWDTARIEEQFSIWVAQYPALPYPKTEASSYDGAHTMWQYTSQGTVPGISAYTDLNVAYFQYNETAAPKNPGAAEEAGDVPIDSTFREANESVTAKDVTNLRTEPSAAANDTIVTSIRNGEWIIRTGISSKGWSRVEYNGQTLYAISSLLLTEEEAANYSGVSPTEPASSTIYTKTNDSVTAKVETNLRDGASTEGTQIIATIHNGEWVTRTGIGSNGWSRLDYNGQTVYALTSYLTTDENFDPDAVDSKNIVWTDTSEAMTAKEVTNLRDKPSTGDGSQVIATIQNGDRIVRTGIGSNGWSRVIYEGQTLYAVSSLLTAYTEE